MSVARRLPALVCVGGAVALRYLLEPVLHSSAHLLIFIIPTVVAALRGAPGAALLATALSTILGAILFVEPVGQVWPSENSDRSRLVVFIALNLAIVAFAVRLHRADRAVVTATGAATHSSGMLATVLDTTPHAIVVTDAEGLVTMWNAAAQEMFGWSASEVIGKPAPHVPEHARAQYVAHRIRVLNGERLTNIEVERQRKDGTTIPCLLSVRPLQRDGRTITGMVATLVNLAQQRALEDQLRHAQKMEAVGELAAGIAHDFNNQLTAILGFAELAASALPPGHPVNADLDEVVKAATSAGSLVRQLLAFSRRQVLQIQPMEATAAVRSMDKMLKRAIHEDVSVRLKLEEQALWINADAAQFQHILLNLVMNARDAMPNGGTVLIEVSSVFLDEAYSAARLEVTPGEHVVVSVTDTGAGMSPEVQARIFEPFFTTKEPGKGTGLGLAMVYGSVRQMGGSIWVYSEPGHGTTFKLYFPRVSPEGARLANGRDAAHASGHETVLVVDDEDVVRQLTARTLTQAGYSVIAAADATQAFNLAREHGRPIDLLVTDVILPGMPGPALAQRFVGEFSLKHVLYTSGYTDLTHLRDQIERGTVNFLAKPFAPPELRAAVRRALKTRA
jgi:two-component system cell cycle sensor histidine kinase/response regulator CckA